MKNAPSIQFYPRDYLADADVRMLNFAQRGIYMDLLCYCWERDGLPHEYGKLVKLLGLTAKEGEALLPEVMELFVKTETGYHHNRLLEQQRLYEERRARGSANVAKRYKQLPSNCLATASNVVDSCYYQTPTHADARVAEAEAVAEEEAVEVEESCSSQGESEREPHSTPRRKPEAEPDGFAEFYDPYPKHVGRAAAVKSWRKLAPSPELRQRINTHVAAMAQTWDWQKDGGQYVPHPATYLNQARWEDELPKTGNGQKPSRDLFQATPSTVDPLEFHDDLPADLMPCDKSARIWAEAMGKLAEQDPEEFEAWLKPLRFLGVVGDRWYVASASRTVCRWAGSNYRDAIEAAAGVPGLAFRLSFLVRP